MFSPRFITLVIIFTAIVCSLVSTLFISWNGYVFGIIAFFILIIATIVKAFEVHERKALKASLNTIFHDKTIYALGIVVALCMIVLFSSSRETGVCETNGHPIFAKRDQYFLQNHNKKTEVSRTRFVMVGASFVIGWHCIVLLAALSFLPEKNKN